MKKCISFFLSVITLLTCFSILSVGSFAGSYEVENNDAEYYATSIDLDEYCTGYLSSAQDIDYYKFTVSEPGKIRLYFEHPYVDYYDNDETYWKIEIYKKNDGTVLTANSYGTTYEGEHTVFVGVDVGTYFISIDSYYDGWHSTFHSDENYTLMIDFVPTTKYENEPENNSYEGAKQISLKTTYYGNLLWSPFSWSGAYDDDVDWFKIKIPYSGIYTLKFKVKYKEDSDWQYEIADSNGITKDSGYLYAPTDTEKLSLKKGTIYFAIKNYDYDNNEYSFSISPYISSPKLKEISNKNNGVKITWSRVSDAEYYRVYRKTKNGSYKYLDSTSNTTFTDKTAKSGIKYYYKVRAKNSFALSSYSNSLSKYYLADTTLSTPKSTKSGITLKWKKVTGADGYQVYRKTGSDSYSKIATVKGNSKITYTDKSAKKGKTYTYKIKVYKSKTYSAYSNAKKIKDKY